MACRAVPAGAAPSSPANPLPQMLSGLSCRLVPGCAKPCRIVPETAFSLWGSRGREFKSRRPDFDLTLMGRVLCVPVFRSINAKGEGCHCHLIADKSVFLPAARMAVSTTTRDCWRFDHSDAQPLATLLNTRVSRPVREPRMVLLNRPVHCKRPTESLLTQFT